MELREQYNLMLLRIKLYADSKGITISNKEISDRTDIPAPNISQMKKKGGKTVTKDTINRIKIAFKNELEESSVIAVAPLVRVLVDRLVHLEVEFSKHHPPTKSHNEIRMAIQNSTRKLADNLGELSLFGDENENENEND